MTKICYNWGDADFTWIGNEFVWNDVCIVEEIIGLKGPTNNWEDAYQKLDKKKQKRFIELVCMVKYGEEYKKVYDDKKEVKDVKLTATDIELTVGAILEVSLIKIL